MNCMPAITVNFLHFDDKLFVYEYSQNLDVNFSKSTF